MRIPSDRDEIFYCFQRVFNKFVFLNGFVRLVFAACGPTMSMEMKIRKRVFLLCLAVGFSMAAHAQDFAVKTNLLPDAALSPNAGVEFRLAPRWSLDVSGQMNLWTVNDRKWKHWVVQPEARYWFCDPFVKHFIGIHALGGRYNVGNIPNGISFLGTDLSKLTDYRYEGWAVGAGVAYGYALPLNRHWNLEFEVGAGYIYTRFDKYECTECSKHLGDFDHHYVGPTKAAINLVYVF